MENTKVALYLSRHGQSHENVKTLVKEDEPKAGSYLTLHGQIESNLTGLHLSSVKLDVAFSSDYGRAMETTKRILGFQGPGAPKLVTLPELKELDFGKYGNTSYSEILRYSVSTGDNPFEWTYPGGEGFPQAGQRMLSAFEEIVDECLKNGYETALITSHSCAIAAFMNAMFNSQHQIHQFTPNEIRILKNCSYFKLEVTRSDVGVLHVRVEEKHRNAHVECINPSSQATPLMQLAIKTGKYINCVQQ